MDDLEKIILFDLVSRYSITSLLDVGANTGEYSSFVKSINSDIDCLMIEANQCCEPHLSSTGIPYAISCLSDVEKDVKLYVNPLDDISTGVSYLQENTRHFSAGEFRIVKAETLMSLLERLKCSHKTFDIVKIDTQGSEKDIIVGGVEVIKKSSFIQLEISTQPYNIGAPLKEEMLNFMNSIGFNVMVKINDMFDGGVKIQENVMFYNRNRLISA